MLLVFLIFILECIYVTIMTCRWIILVKGYTTIASTIAFIEQLLYVFALTLVVTRLSDPWRILGFAVGYAVGTFVGSIVERKLAVGFVAFHVITDETGLAQLLRTMGTAVTSWRGEGRDGQRDVLMIVVRRKLVRETVRRIEAVDPDAFITRTELQSLAGGYLFRK